MAHLWGWLCRGKPWGMCWVMVLCCDTVKAHDCSLSKCWSQGKLFMSSLLILIAERLPSKNGRSGIYFFIHHKLCTHNNVKYAIRFVKKNHVCMYFIQSVLSLYLCNITPLEESSHPNTVGFDIPYYKLTNLGALISCVCLSMQPRLLSAFWEGLEALVFLNTEIIWLR